MAVLWFNRTSVQYFPTRRGEGNRWIFRAPGHCSPLDPQMSWFSERPWACREFSEEQRASVLVFNHHPQGCTAEGFALTRLSADNCLMVMHILYSHITPEPTTYNLFVFSYPTLVSVSLFMNIMNEATYGTYITLYMRDTHIHSQFTWLLWGSSTCRLVVIPDL